MNKRDTPYGDSIPALSQIYFYLTDGCNLACRHCWLAPKRDLTGALSRHLSKSGFRTVIEEGKPLGLKKVKLTGGEPLLHPDFLRLLHILREENIELALETNGTLCTPDIAQGIGAALNPSVAVSLDGADAQTHEQLRNVPGSFEAAQRGIENLVAQGIKPQIIMTLTRFNKDQVEPLIRLADDLGASSIKFNLIQPTARGKNLQDTGQVLSLSEYIRIGRHIDMQLASASPLPLHYDYPLAFRPLSRLANHGDTICGILGVMGVLPTGHYALCGIGEHIPELVFGAIGRDPLETLWRYHPVLQSLRQGLPTRLEGVCADCLMQSRCLGSCVAQNYYSKGSLWAPFWFCQQAAQQGLFPESRLRSMKKERN
ncbi:MAG: SynChlorMet cassette radical SAM/SPASM protein ScmF [Desulfobacteraceae bacterium]|nr:MAG: SynChlorMet cassette radical SAM/SPASM protein ScmF [Desulfobacteraceae bacterium]